jgi:hypothetical protein
MTCNYLQNPTYNPIYWTTDVVKTKYLKILGLWCEP